MLPRDDFAWLLRLRWAAVLVELWILLTSGHPLHHLGPALGLVGAAAASNLWGHRRGRRTTAPPTWVAAALLAVDVAVLTGVLWQTGGAANPYSVFYLTFVALAVIALPAAWAWGLVALSVAGFAALFVAPGTDHPHDMGAHLRGMWFAFALTAVALVSFVGRLNTARRAAEQAAAQAARLASLGTLAAGAAHELASPLGTIAIAAKDLRLALQDPELAEDAALIGDEVRRCQRILERLAANAGQTTGEAVRRLPVPALVQGVLAECQAPARVAVTVEPALADRAVAVFEHAFTEAVRSVLDNALRADAGQVALAVRAQASGLLVVVRDQGPGMPPDVRARATDPFFTTQPAGQGSGLGLFLARSLVERAGGALVLESAVGVGTTVSLSFPEPVG
ncbi:MAG: HAMP domain-containing histidine kinase [Myxococcales bacterium]|nr:HAMP domain-containing histidine kinase [Myxococcales bacterium]